MDKQAAAGWIGYNATVVPVNPGLRTNVIPLQQAITSVSLNVDSCKIGIGDVPLLLL